MASVPVLRRRFGRCTRMAVLWPVAVADDRKPVTPGRPCSTGGRHPLGQDLCALILGQAAPDAVRLAHFQRMLAALLDHWARGADGLGVGVPATSRGASL